ncbi:MAG TPA: NRDE family protein [Saprospiraceae bacterium]
MCTVTFIPFQQTYFITSNRDESPGRQSTGLISTHTPEWNAIHYPLDELSGGSWIALADSGKVICLLNGGFVPFIPKPPYRMSRGQVVTEVASATDTLSFLHEFSLEEIAPFTMLVFENNVLTQLVWDGGQKHFSTLPNDQPQIWSSVTLYPEHVRAWRKSLFEKWLTAHQTYDRESIIAFHQLANGDPDNDFVMNRNDIVRTLSITSISLQQHSGSIVHLALDKASREEIMVRYDG